MFPLLSYQRSAAAEIGHGDDAEIAAYIGCDLLAHYWAPLTLAVERIQTDDPRAIRANAPIIGDNVLLQPIEAVDSLMMPEL